MTDNAATTNYAHPEMLVDTAWLLEHQNDPKVRVVESDEDILLYDQGHVPGAVMIDWVGDLNDRVRRDYLGNFAGDLSGRKHRGRALAALSSGWNANRDYRCAATGSLEHQERRPGTFRPGPLADQIEF